MQMSFDLSYPLNPTAHAHPQATDAVVYKALLLILQLGRLLGENQSGIEHCLGNLADDFHFDNIGGYLVYR